MKATLLSYGSRLSISRSLVATIFVAALSFVSSPASARGNVCEDQSQGQSPCSLAEQQVVSVATSPSPQKSTEYGGHMVLDPTFEGTNQAVDWDGDGLWDTAWGDAGVFENDPAYFNFDDDDDGLFVDIDGDMVMDSVDLDNDGNIDLGPGGDGTIFHLGWPSVPMFEGAWLTFDPMTGIVNDYAGIGGVFTSDPAHAPLTAPIQNTKSLIHDDAHHGDGNNSDTHDQSAADDAGSATEQAEANISGPRPRCPDGYGEHGNGGSGDGAGGGRPGRQADGGGTRN